MYNPRHQLTRYNKSQASPGQGKRDLAIDEVVVSFQRSANIYFRVAVVQTWWCKARLAFTKKNGKINTNQKAKINANINIKIDIRKYC